MPDRIIQVEIVGDAAQLERAFGRAAFAGQKLERQLQTSGRAMQRNITLPLLAGGVAAVKLEQDFDAVIAKMKGLAGVSDQQGRAWRQNILELAPKVGKAPKELAEALYQVASSGVPASKALDVVTVSAKASAAGMGDTATIADAVTSVLNAYGTANITAAKATDIFVQAVKDGKGEAADFAPVIGKVVAVAAPLGVSFDQVAAALARMTQFGVPADDAATQLSATFSEMLKVTPKAEKALEAVGLSAAELRKELREKGLLATLEDLNERFHGSTTAMAEAFPNVRALRGVLQLLGGDAGATAKIFDDTKDSTGALGHAFKEASDTDAFKMQQALADLKTSAIELGDTLAPLVEDLADDLHKVTSAYQDLTPEQKKFVTKLAEAAAVAGPLVLFAGKAIAVANAIKKIGGAATAAAGASEAGGVGLLIARLGVLSKLGPIALAIDLSRGGDSLAWKLVSATFKAGETVADYAYGSKSVGERLFPTESAPEPGPQKSLQEKFRNYISNPNLTFRTGGGGVQVVNSQGTVFHTFKPTDTGTAAAFYVAAKQRAEMPVDQQHVAAAQAAASYGTQSASNATEKAVLGFATKFGPGSGITYHWGGVSPVTGFDCSGYLYAAYAAAGITIPRTTRGQWADPHAIDTTGHEEPGDGVYFTGSLTGKNAGPPPGHCGIYIGNDRYIEYFSEGKPAKVSLLSQAGDYMGARRWAKVSQQPGSEPSKPSAPASDYDPVAAAKKAAKKSKAPSIVTGMGLLSIGAQTAITKAERTAGTADDVKAYEAALTQLRAKLKTTTGEQKLEVEKEITDIQGRIDSIKSTRYQAQMQKIAAATKKALDDAKRAVEQKRSAFEDAFQSLAGKALDAFDRETQKKLDQLQITISGSGFASFLFGGSITQTPTEKKIAELQAQRAKAQRAAAVASAQSDLEKAKADGDPDAIRQAQQELDDAEFDQRLADLQEQADRERAAADKQLDDAKSALEDQRAAERDNFQSRLSDLQTYLETRTTTIKKANDAVLALFKQFGIDLANVPGLDSALNATLTADQNLQLGQADLSKLQGGSGAQTGIPGIVLFDPNSNTLKRLPSFDTGGIVPGPIGQPTVAVVHGGEQVLTVAQQNTRPQIHVDVHVGGSVISDDELTLTVLKGLQRIADRSPGGDIGLGGRG